jgi:hypothetical protein
MRKRRPAAELVSNQANWYRAIAWGDDELSVHHHHFAEGIKH